MDLNLAMVNLYKQRQSRGGAGSTRSKRLSNENGGDRKVSRLDGVKKELHDSMIQDLDASNHSSKIDKALAALDIKPTTSFERLYGIENLQPRLERAVQRFQRAVRGDTKKAGWPLLICGSRGLGKTAIVEAAANYGKLNLISIPLRQMVAQTRNEFKESLEHLIRHSISSQPAIVLIDDLDIISDKDEFRYLIDEAVARLRAEQLKLMVICTTSSTLECQFRIHFRDILHIQRPSLDARYKMLSSLRSDNDFLRGLTDDCLQTIATNTPSFTFLDLLNMLDNAEDESCGELTLKHCEVEIEKIKQMFRHGTHLIGEKPTVTWNDIGGMTKVRKTFSNILAATRIPGRSKVSGVALYGPPGCGKTMVAKAMANEAGFNFISIKPSELTSKYLGETERNIRRVFQEAREYEPCIIYFDEFDGLCGNRENKDNLTNAIQTLLSEMDGFTDRGQNIVIVSTNRPQDIDSAMMRPGRLSEKIYVGPPDQEARREILSLITNKPWLALAPDVDLDLWAARMDSFTGAEVAGLVTKAELQAVGELVDVSKGITPIERLILRQEHFLNAMNEIISSKNDLEKQPSSVKRLGN